MFKVRVDLFVSVQSRNMFVCVQSESGFVIVQGGSGLVSVQSGSDFSVFRVEVVSLLVFRV